jgi:uncharacterized membrane protein YgdD (TMEM256/DUF423 family)
MKFIRFAAISGVIVVALGAFGAHSLKAVLSPEQLQTFETGVRYQFYHTLALLFVGLLMNTYPSKTLNMAGGSFLAGIICFSGSLYLLATRSLLGIENLTLLGPVTPIGGLLFIIGWVFVILATKKMEMPKKS